MTIRVWSIDAFDLLDDSRGSGVDALTRIAAINEYSFHACGRSCGVIHQQVNRGVTYLYVDMEAVDGEICRCRHAGCCPAGSGRMAVKEALRCDMDGRRPTRRSDMVTNLWSDNCYGSGRHPRKQGPVLEAGSEARA
jgi:hypothetical protein